MRLWPWLACIAMLTGSNAAAVDLPQPSDPVIEVATEFVGAQAVPGDAGGYIISVGAESEAKGFKLETQGVPDGWNVRVDPPAFDVVAQPSPFRPMGIKLPSERCCMALAEDGRYGYLLGGRDDDRFFSQILRFDPFTDRLQNLGDLPRPIHGPSAVLAGTTFYTFGGAPEPGWDSNLIMKYDYATGVGKVLDAKLPFEVRFAQAVWVPQAHPGCPEGCAYVIGGGAERDGQWYFNADIARFDPSTETASLVESRLPSGRWTSVGYDGRNVYVFGGEGPTKWNFQDQIVRFDPQADEITVQKARLPSPRSGMSVAWDGVNFLIFGGRTKTESVDDIVVYNPATDVAVKLARRLPLGSHAHSAMWAGRHAYVFGGVDTDWTPIDMIWRYDPLAIGATVRIVVDIPATEKEKQVEFEASLVCPSGKRLSIILDLLVDGSISLGNGLAGLSKARGRCSPGAVDGERHEPTMAPGMPKWKQPSERGDLDSDSVGRLVPSASAVTGLLCTVMAAALVCLRARRSAR